MSVILDWLFGTVGGTPLQLDTLRRPDILIPQTVGDLVLATSYLAVLAVLIWFLRRRPDLVRDHRLLAFLTGCFLALSAVARLADAISIWRPVPGTLVGVKEYRDLTAGWYGDIASIYDELIRPRKAAHTMEEFDALVRPEKMIGPGEVRRMPNRLCKM